MDSVIVAIEFSVALQSEVVQRFYLEAEVENVQFNRRIKRGLLYCCGFNAF